jgi:hypothetical protein
MLLRGIWLFMIFTTVGAAPLPAVRLPFGGEFFPLDAILKNPAPCSASMVRSRPIIVKPGETDSAKISLSEGYARSAGLGPGEDLGAGMAGEESSRDAARAM